MTILLVVTTTTIMETMMEVLDKAMRVIENITRIEVEEVAGMISVTVGMRWKRGVGAGKKDPAVDESVAIAVCLPEPCKPPHEPDYEYQKTIQVANSRNVVLLFLRYDIYDSPIPATFFRSAPPIMAGTKFPTPLLLPRDISTCGIDECLPIVLTSEIGHGATGIVHGGTLQLESAEGSVPLDNRCQAGI